MKSEALLIGNWNMDEEKHEILNEMLPLYPSGKPHGTGGRHQGSEEGGDGIVEADPAGGRQRFLPPAGLSWQGDLHCQNKALLR